MRFVRYVLPALIAVVGLVLALTVYGGTDTAVDALVALAGAGAATFMINMFLRMGFGDREQQDRDEAARAFFDRYGMWPDDVPEGWEPPPAGYARPHGDGADGVRDRDGRGERDRPRDRAAAHG